VSKIQGYYERWNRLLIVLEKKKRKKRKHHTAQKLPSSSYENTTWNSFLVQRLCSKEKREGEREKR